MPDETPLTKADYDTAIANCYLRAQHLSAMRDLLFPAIEARARKDLLLDLIVEKVCQSQKVDPDELRNGRRRMQHIAATRQVAMYLSRALGCGSYPEIANYFNRDHSTVIWAYQTISKRIAGSTAYARTIAQLREEISPSALEEIAA